MHVLWYLCYHWGKDEGKIIKKLMVNIRINRIAKKQPLITSKNHKDDFIRKPALTIKPNQWKNQQKYTRQRVHKTQKCSTSESMEGYQSQH